MSYIYYDGRNIIPRANSNAKCLLENYVEERAVAELDAARRRKEEEGAAKKAEQPQTGRENEGHKDLLTSHYDDPIRDCTTHLDFFRPYTGPISKTKGSRRELKEKLMVEQAVKEVEEELHPPFVDEYISTKQQDYDKEFERHKPAPTTERDYTREQPVTFWTEHRDKIHSVTQVRPTFDSAFRKNTSFSRPISERWDPEDVKPYERNHVPNI